MRTTSTRLGAVLSPRQREEREVEEAEAQRAFAGIAQSFADKVVEVRTKEVRVLGVGMVIYIKDADLLFRFSFSPLVPPSPTRQKAAADPGIVVEEDWLKPRLQRLVAKAGVAVAEQVRCGAFGVICGGGDAEIYV